MRPITVGAAQLGPIQKAEGRDKVVGRMIALLDEAAEAGCDLVVFPELALTTFFPRWYMEDQAEVDTWFERAMPNGAVQPLFDAAKAHGIAISFGYGELTPDGRHFNTSILTDRQAAIVGKYRKIHLPGHSEYDTERAFQHLEKRYFEPGDLGFPVWNVLGGIIGMCICNDRRWPETYRVMGLQGVEMVVLGYNTPAVNSQRGEEGPEERLFHHRLVLQSGAYQNATWVVAVAKAGVEDGHPLIGGSVIVDPEGRIVAESKTEDDELIVHTCDLDATTFGKSTIFDFARHRRTEHYGLITARTGAAAPTETAPPAAGNGAPPGTQPSGGVAFRFDQLSPRERYKMLISAVVPRPVAWITSVGPDGVVNAAPFSFFNVFSEDPALVIIGMDRRPDGELKHTLLNIEQGETFTVHIADQELLSTMVETAALFPRDIGEPDALGIRMGPGVTHAVPRILDAPVALECRLWKLMPVGSGRTLVFGEVKALVAREGLFDPETKRIDSTRYAPVARLHGAYYANLTDPYEKAVPDWRSLVRQPAAAIHD